jgi:hypothetical protein
VETQGVSLTGSLSVANGRAAIANSSTVTAGDRTADVQLARGGSLKICATTTLHLSRDVAPISGSSDKDSAGLMLALDRGALEASYSTGRYSDVLLTPDLRILVSGPGEADVKLRVNLQGDTCVDNHGVRAPYVTVSSLMDGGVYRVQPGQRVLFEHGSLNQVVDNELEPCGCPVETPAAGSIQAPDVAGKHVGGPSSTPADTAFPTAVSEGLAAPPASPSTPVVPAGEAHAQVTASLSNDTPPTPPTQPAPPAAVATASAPPTVSSPPAPAPATSPATPQASAAKHGVFGSIGHFFARVFGAS